MFRGISYLGRVEGERRDSWSVCFKKDKEITRYEIE